MAQKIIWGGRRPVEEISPSPSGPPTPSPEVSPSVSASPAASPSVSPSASPAASPSVSPPGSPSPSASPEGSPSPSPVVDEDRIFLAHCEDGIDGSQVFLDHALGGNAPHTVTARGTAQVDTAQQKYGAASWLLDGNSDYAEVDDDPDFAYGANPFTIEGWARFNVLPAPGGQSYLYGQRVDGAHALYSFVNNTGGVYTLRFGAWDGGELVDINGVITPSVNTWYHFAVVRDVNRFDVYWEGTSVANDTQSVTLPNLAANVFLGRWPGGSSDYLNGWLDEYSISTVARWAGGGGPYVPAGPFSPYL